MCFDPVYGSSSVLHENSEQKATGCYQSALFTNECRSDCLKKNNIKIYMKTAPKCFGAVTPSSGSALFVLTKVTVVKIVSYGTSVCD
jgi:hypothetical protein